MHNSIGMFLRLVFLFTLLSFTLNCSIFASPSSSIYNNKAHKHKNTKKNNIKKIQKKSKKNTPPKIKEIVTGPIVEAPTTLTPQILPIKPNLNPSLNINTSNYQPYMQIGGIKFFNLRTNKVAATADVFIPIWQNDLKDLIFSDLRIIKRNNFSFEGNVHLGYRHLFQESQQELGFYSSWDRNKTQYGNYFDQLTFGGEYWHKKWFVGANVYQPIGKRIKPLNSLVEIATIQENFAITTDAIHEEALGGADGEVGYEFIEGLAAYGGGYYFSANGAPTVCGPRLRLTYDWQPSNGRIFGLFDQVGLEAGIQNDKPRGTTGYLSANIRIGWFVKKKTVLSGISRHMVDPVRRDVDIVTASYATTTESDITDMVNQLKSKYGDNYDMIYNTILREHGIHFDKTGGRFHHNVKAFKINSHNHHDHDHINTNYHGDTKTITVKNIEQTRTNDVDIIYSYKHYGKNWHIS
jgi:hypothetical protein